MVGPTTFQMHAKTLYRLSRSSVYLTALMLVCWASQSLADTTLEFSSFSADGFKPTTDTPNEFDAQGSVRIRGTRDPGDSFITFDPINVQVNGTHWDFTLTFDATSFDFGTNNVTGMSIAMTGFHNTAPHPDDPFNEEPNNILPQISATVSGNIGTTSSTRVSAQDTEPHDEEGDAHLDTYGFGFTERNRDGQFIAFMRTNLVNDDNLDLHIQNIRIRATHPPPIVPAPSTLVLSAIGAVCLGARTKRNRSRKKSAAGL